MVSDGTNAPNASAGKQFNTTHWSVVLKAGQPEATGYRDALETLCRTYWYPLYSYLRRRGYSAHEAEDYTQGFFTILLEKCRLRQADPGQGRFRSFLLASLRHFVADERDRAEARKRGGDQRRLSLDMENAERRYALEQADRLSPEKLFERSWALTVLREAMVRLRAEWTAAGRENVLEQLKGYLEADASPPSYPEVAAALGMTEVAVRVAVHRLKCQYGQLVRQEIRQTVATADQVEEELCRLFDALR